MKLGEKRPWVTGSFCEFARNGTKRSLGPHISYPDWKPNTGAVPWIPKHSVGKGKLLEKEILRLAGRAERERVSGISPRLGCGSAKSRAQAD